MRRAAGDILQSGAGGVVSTTELVFLAGPEGEAERFRVDERRVMCASCGVLCSGSLCRECEAIELARPLGGPEPGASGQGAGDR